MRHKCPSTRYHSLIMYKYLIDRQSEAPTQHVGCPKHGSGVEPVDGCRAVVVQRVGYAEREKKKKRNRSKVQANGKADTHHDPFL